MSADAAAQVDPDGSGRGWLVIVAVLAVPVLVIAGFVAVVIVTVASMAGAASCSASGAVDTTTSTTAGTVAGRSWSAAQLANIKVVIGVAKTMFPDQAEKAAIIGLMVADTESGFRNYANDGKVDSHEALSADTSTYGNLSYSLSLPHDAVGSNYSSVGIMQQQAAMSWGNWQSSTWQSDPHGVLQRLMLPAFAAGKFYVAMQNIDPRWATMDPAVVAQDVQVSGPDAYAQSRALAQGLWDALGQESPAVSPPAEVGWMGPGQNQDAVTTAIACAGTVNVSGDKKQLASWILSSGKVTLQGNPGDLANALGQVQAIANGTSTRCNINMGVLQIIVVAANSMGHITVSSINRNNTCTGQDSTTFNGSYHSIEGGGHAVDFTGDGINGTADAATTKLLNGLRAYLPPQAPGDPYFTWIGQEQCRGYALNWPGIYEGDDSCTHQHINISPKYNNTGLPAFTSNPVVTGLAATTTNR